MKEIIQLLWKNAIFAVHQLPLNLREKGNIMENLFALNANQKVLTLILIPAVLMITIVQLK